MHNEYSKAHMHEYILCGWAQAYATRPCITIISFTTAPNYTLMKGIDGVER